MTSTPWHRPVGDRQTACRPLVGRACLAELRERLAQRCGDEDGGDGSLACGIRDAVDAAVGTFVGASPLVDARAVRSVGDGDLVWCAQAVQRAINMLEGARSVLAAEAVRRRLHARRGEASGAETLVNATGVGGSLARRVEREAEVLKAQPRVAEALGRGTINADQAAVVAAADVPDDVRHDLCTQAENQTADQTRQTVRAAEAAWRRESDEQRRARQRAARSASMWVDPQDGMWHLRAKFDALTGDAVNRLLVREIERNWRSDKDLPESRRRSVPQRAADALARLLTATGAQGGGAAAGNAAAGGGARHVDCVSLDAAAAGGGARHADCVSLDAAAAAGASEAAVAGDVVAESAAGEVVAESAAGDAVAKSAAGDVSALAGESLSDGGWVVPSATQMIVLTTLDNLRGGSNGRLSAAGVNGESPRHLARRPNPRRRDQALAAGVNGESPRFGHPPLAAPGAECTDMVSKPAMGLLAVPGATAVTENGTVLGAAELRRIACDTRVIPVVMGGPSEVLDVGRAKRTISPAIRRALIARDQGCVWPGCERAPIHCDGHHIQHWLDDGPTCVANLALLCHSHHHRLHEYHLMLHPPTGPAPPGEGWTVTPAPPREEVSPRATAAAVSEGWTVTPAPPHEPRTPARDHVRQDC